MDPAEADFFELLACADSIETEAPISKPVVETVNDTTNEAPDGVNEHLLTTITPPSKIQDESGNILVWNEQLRGYFPELSDQEIVSYQNSYYYNSTISNGSLSKDAPDLNSNKTKVDNSSKKRNLNADTTYNNKNTSIFLSNLPADVTESEVSTFCKRAGIIKLDPLTHREKIKLYKDSDGNNKGECLVTFHRLESVDLALNFLNNSYLERCIHGKVVLSDLPITVTQATFTHVSRDNVKVDPIIDSTIKKQKRANNDVMKRLLSWNEDECEENGGNISLDTGKYASISESHLLSKAAMILENVFSPSDINYDHSLLQDLKDDLKSEAEKFGVVKKVTLYDQHPKGIVKIDFAKNTINQTNFNNAIQSINGRLFDGRILVCYKWDNITSYETIDAQTKFLESIDSRSLF